MKLIIMWLFERACQRRPGGAHPPPPPPWPGPEESLLAMSWSHFHFNFISSLFHLNLPIPVSIASASLSNHHRTFHSQFPPRLITASPTEQLPTSSTPEPRSLLTQPKISNNSRRKPHGCMWVGWDVCLWTPAIKVLWCTQFLSMFLRF